MPGVPDPIFRGSPASEPSSLLIVPGIFGAGLGSVSVATGDFNGDGAQDLVVANRYSNDVSVLINKTTHPPH